MASQVSPATASSRIPFATQSASLDPFFRASISPSHRHIITRLLLDAEAESKEYQVEISRLKTAMLALEAKRKGLNQLMDHYRSLLSPIHRLPQETLTSIFGFVCDVNELYSSIPSPAMALSAVCGRWRELAIATPSLWASIEIDSACWVKDNYWLLPHLTQIFLERSKSVPLKLDLNFLDFDFDAEGWEDAKKMFEVLVQHSHRWYSLKLCILHADLDHDLLQSLRGRLPMLKHISVDNEHQDDDDDGTTAPWDIFELCPNLTSFSLQPGDSLTKGIILPWQQITSATFNRSYLVHNAFDILSRCPNLDWLYLGSPVADGGGSDRVHHLHSSTIRHLSVYAITHKKLSHVVGSMTLPQLTSVEISGGRRMCVWNIDTTWDGNLFNDFLLRSSCPLTSLHLKFLPIMDHQLISLLELLPSLRVLLVEQDNFKDRKQLISEAFFERLTVSYRASTTALFLPRLTDLTLTVPAKDLPHDVLLQALSSRWLPQGITHNSPRQIDPLQSFSLTVLGFEGDPEPECFASLQHLRDAGLRVVMRHVTKGYNLDDC